MTDNDVEIFEENNGIIMVIHVPKAKREQKPVYINGDMFSGTFRRNWEGDYHCDRSEVLAMLRDQPEETAGNHRRIRTRQNHFKIIVCKKSGDKKW